MTEERVLGFSVCLDIVHAESRYTLNELSGFLSCNIGPETTVRLKQQFFLAESGFVCMQGYAPVRCEYLNLVWTKFSFKVLLKHLSEPIT